MDSPEKHTFTFTMANSFYFYFKDQTDIDKVWEALTYDGKEWPCGWMEDRYGALSGEYLNKDLLNWTNSSDSEKARHATQEMYKMKKINLAQIKQAFDGTN